MSNQALLWAELMLLEREHLDPKIMIGPSRHPDIISHEYVERAKAWYCGGYLTEPDTVVTVVTSDPQMELPL